MQDSPMRVLLTGQPGSNKKATLELERLGASAIDFPLQSYEIIDSSLADHDFSGKSLIFTSPLAVDFFFDLVPNKTWKYTWSVGPATSEKLLSYNCPVDWQPESDYSALGLIALLNTLDLVNESFLSGVLGHIAKDIRHDIY